MKEELDKKIDYYRGILINRLQSMYSIDINKSVERDIRIMYGSILAFRKWQADNDRIKAGSDYNYDNIVKSYFVDDDNRFNLLLAEHLIESLSKIDPTKGNEVINQVALAIAYEKINMQFLSHVIASCPNS